MFDSEPTKQMVVEKLMDGYNFHQIAKETKMKNNQIYKIKRELEQDLSFIYDDAKRLKFVEDNPEVIEALQLTLVEHSKVMLFTEWVDYFVNDYDPEAEAKSWKAPPIQDEYDRIWKTYRKSCSKFPREHLKTTSVIEWLARLIFERDYPLEIDYFHLNDDIAVEKIRKLQQIIERNPWLAANAQLDKAKNWSDGEIRLLDGTTIKANSYLSGSVGKHPHVIILDDIIDKDVIYSEAKNDRAIRKFYMDIYPMISKDDPDRRIIIIGTSQREDDIYEKLPADFHTETHAAFLDEEETKPLAPELFTAEALHKIKKDMSEQFGEKFWLKEYMNKPMSAMGLIIKPEWIRTYSTEPDIDELDLYQGWDLSVGKDLESGDWTVGATIGLKKLDEKLLIYILELYRARIAFPERLKAIVSVYNKWKKVIKVGVEENVFQYDTVKTLIDQTNMPIEGVKSVKNKTESFQVELAPHFENGKVLIPAHDLELKQELLSLPAGAHDDRADAIKIAIKVSSLETTEIGVLFI